MSLGSRDSIIVDGMITTGLSILKCLEKVWHRDAKQPSNLEFMGFGNDSTHFNELTKSGEIVTRNAFTNINDWAQS